MSKGIVSTKIRTDGTRGFYVGRRKATPEEVKQYARNNYDVVLKNKDTMPADLTKYAARVKGGKVRAANTITDEKGHFVSDKALDGIVKAAKHAGIDVKRLQDAAGVETLQGLFKKMPKVAKAIGDLVTVGILRHPSEKAAREEINNYTGEVYVNGKLTSHENAARRLSSFLHAMKRVSSNLDARIAFKYEGVTKLHLSFPGKYALDKALEDGAFDDIDSANEWLGGNGYAVQLFGSVNS